MASSSQPLAHLALGDVAVLPDGRSLTVRSRVDLPRPVGSMSTFVVLGEFDALLSATPVPNGPVLVYVPVTYLPEAASRARVEIEGVASYWAPHLPAVSGAMGEILYRVITVPGAIDPLVLTYRGPELVVFIRATQADADQLHFLHMRRDVDNQMPVARHSGIVRSPRFDPAPNHLPVEEPAAASILDR